MEGQAEIAQKLWGWIEPGVTTAETWPLSPAAWSQFALLVAAFIAARLLTARVTPVLDRMIRPVAGKTGLVFTARRFAIRFLPLLLPVIAFALTAVGEEVTRSIFGTGAVIAFGKRAFLFLAARIFVREVLTDPFLRFLGRYVLIPVAAVHAHRAVEIKGGKL